MSDAAALLRQRARLFQEQQKKREASKAAVAKPPPPSAAASTAALVPSASSAPAGAPKVAFAASYDDDSTAQQLSRPAKRPPPSLDSADDPSPAKKAKLSPALNGSAEPPAGSDPLDAFMSNLAGRMSDEEKAALAGKPSPPPPTPSPSTSSPADADGGSPPTSSTSSAVPSASRDGGGLERFFGDDEGAFDEDELDAIARDALDDPKSKVKKKELHAVDHATYPYIPIRKDFWIQSRDITALSDEEIDERRRVQLEGVKIRGKNCPRPFFEWNQCGLGAKTAEVIAASGYTRPFPIQSQAIPVIMSGRDCIACAKTGSGSVPIKPQRPTHTRSDPPSPISPSVPLSVLVGKPWPLCCPSCATRPTSPTSSPARAPSV